MLIFVWVDSRENPNILHIVVLLSLSIREECVVLFFRFCYTFNAVEDDDLGHPITGQRLIVNIDDFSLQNSRCMRRHTLA